MAQNLSNTYTCICTKRNFFSYYFLSYLIIQLSFIPGGYWKCPWSIRMKPGYIKTTSDILTYWIKQYAVQRAVTLKYLLKTIVKKISKLDIFLLIIILPCLVVEVFVEQKTKQQQGKIWKHQPISLDMKKNI